MRTVRPEQIGMSSILQRIVGNVRQPGLCPHTVPPLGNGEWIAIHIQKRKCQFRNQTGWPKQYHELVESWTIRLLQDLINKPGIVKRTIATVEAVEDCGFVQIAGEKPLPWTHDQRAILSWI